jgi:transcriptional regulator with XRE-family HTH domain
MHQAEWFKARMKQLKVTQDVLGRALHRDRTVVSRIINGEQDLGLKQILPLAAALEVSPFEILYRAGMWGGDPQQPGRDEREELIGIYEMLPPLRRSDFIKGVRAFGRAASSSDIEAALPAEPATPARRRQGGQ